MFKMQFFFGVLFAIILMSKHVSSNAEIQEKESVHLSNDYGNSHFFFFFQWKVPSTWDYMWKTNHKEYSNTVCALFFFFISNAFNLLTFKFNFSQLTYCQSRYTLVISPSNQIITFCLVKKKLNV